MSLKKHIPNLLTCANLFCGCLAILEAVDGKLDHVIFYVIAGGIFDFLDGFAARMLKVTSDIGKDLDSLADMVTFSIVPSLVMYHMISASSGSLSWLKYLGLLIAVFSALRLAKFNNDTRQGDSFYGLPTPANAFFCCSLPLLLEGGIFVGLLQSGIVISVVSIVMSVLMVSDIKLLALKFKHFKFKGNESRYVLITTSLVGLATFQLLALPFVILFYLILSIIVGAVGRNKI